ncbi:hypothetical protein BC332_26094 [Capsicum chinense]|nr:hypothetical protein BC332_26094 [Capsicum chinense]
MSSSKWVGNPSNSSAKQKEQVVDEINLGVRDMGLNSEQNDGWEVYARKCMKECSSQEYFPPVAYYDKAGENDVEDNELDFIDKSDDDLQYDDFDSDVTETSYEMCKKNRWFKQLLESRDSLTVTEINDSERQWQCPAWKVGPGTIKWFTGLQSLITHAKTKRVRVKLHRELAEHLEEELCQRGTSVVPPSEMYGKRDGVEFKDKEIVWTPMVVIMNTRLDKDENDKGRDNTKFIELQDKEIEEFMEERVTLVQTHEYRIVALRCKHWEQEVEPKRKVYLELAKLMEKYSSKQWHQVQVLIPRLDVILRAHWSTFSTVGQLGSVPMAQCYTV